MNWSSNAALWRKATRRLALDPSLHLPRNDFKEMEIHMFIVYSYSIAGLLVILATVFLQNIVAAVAHRKQSHYVPGKVSESLSHDSFVFRSHRTFHNSLENIHQFVIPALLCILLGAPTTVLAWLVWIYAAARIIHMTLYYAIATEKNPSPRSYFYMLGVLCTAGVFALAFYALFT